MPGGRVSPSSAPSTAVSEPLALLKAGAPALEYIWRRYSMPPRGFLPLAATMNGSPAAAYTPAAESLSEVDTLGTGNIPYSKVGGVSFFCSFSSQLPLGYRATLSWFCLSWTSVWLRPSRDLSLYLAPIAAHASADLCTASFFQALSSRLSMFLRMSAPPIFAAEVRMIRYW